jgi:hypothetical protein
MPKRLQYVVTVSGISNAQALETITPDKWLGHHAIPQANWAKAAAFSLAVVAPSLFFIQPIATPPETITPDKYSTQSPTPLPRPVNFAHLAPASSALVILPTLTIPYTDPSLTMAGYFTLGTQLSTPVIQWASNRGDTRFQFTGTQLELQTANAFGAGTCFVTIDGGAPVSATIPSGSVQWVVLATGLADTTHLRHSALEHDVRHCAESDVPGHGCRAGLRAPARVRG